MNLQKHITAMLMLCAGFLGISAWASDAPTFRLTNRMIPERGQVSAVEIPAGEKRVSLILPKNWRVGQSAEGVLLQAGDFSATLSVKAVKSGATLSKEMKDKLAPSAPRVEIEEEYPWTTGLGEATVFDARMGEKDDLQIQTRTFILKLEEYSLVFNLTAPIGKFNQAQLLVSSLMSSLRAE
ncbi:hypothetical protein NXS98_16710 [Fontisphaera persica]|uniref:hypothetical protein n=1 Tax=Fontisphaera persica TaxID=2974023 RepID=UPI0024C05D3F|nr:hypothetical protein [Fontisphaera persica]WCJ59340.1 hypothetical protein NXS98_16710 [Fontisphaera persica]